MHHEAGMRLQGTPVSSTNLTLQRLQNQVRSLQSENLQLRRGKFSGSGGMSQSFTDLANSSFSETVSAYCTSDNINIYDCTFSSCSAGARHEPSDVAAPRRPAGVAAGESRAVGGGASAAQRSDVESEDGRALQTAGNAHAADQGTAPSYYGGRSYVKIN